MIDFLDIFMQGLEKLPIDSWRLIDILRDIFEGPVIGC